MSTVKEAPLAVRNAAIYMCPECGEIFPFHHVTTSNCPMCHAPVEASAYLGQDYWLVYLAGGFFVAALAIMLGVILS